MTRKSPDTVSAAAEERAAELGVVRKTLTLIIPVFFNAESLPAVFDDLRELEGALWDTGLRLELIFVDDGSQDTSLALLLRFREQRPGTKVLKLSRNFGAPAAVKSALRFVTGDCFMFFAADRQEPTEQVVAMAREWLSGHRYVIAVRASRGDPLATRIFSAAFHRLVQATIANDYPHRGVGLMLMDRVMLPFMATAAKNANPNVYSFWLGFAPKTLSYARREREHGRSRWSVRKRVKYVIDTVTAFSVVPIRVMSLVGVTIASVSFVYGVVIVVSAIRGAVPVPGFATLAVINAFIGGSILTMLGVIGEYLWRIFDHVSARPESVIDELYIDEEPSALSGTSIRE